jgi:cellulose synthase/poly-beta-1,6-N-acetylglucosamine synthase-like glycosyltransferase
MELFGRIFMMVYLGLVFILSLYGLHRYWILYLYFRYYKWAAPLPCPALPAVLPHITVQLPLYNERYVAERLIDSICALEYPRERLEIQVLDDSTDMTREIVAEKVRAMREQGFDVVHVHRMQRTGFKAGALGEGLTKAKGEFIAIFDADFLPPTDFLLKTVPYFENANLGMVQTRWGHLNDQSSILTGIQAIFLDGHFLLEHTARNRSGAFFNFNGTAGIWRRATIETSGGWQADTLTEDLDLSYRAQMAGWKFLFLPDVVCPAELPVDINAFKTQQNRWTIGAIQTAKKMLPQIWASNVPMKVKIEATFHLTGCLGYLLMAGLSVSLPFSVILRGHQHWLLTGWVEGLALVGTTLSLGLFYGVCLKEIYPDWKSRLRHLPLMISVGVGMCFSNTMAVLRGLSRRQFEFRRTPKFSILERDRSWKKKGYRNDSLKAGWLEMIFAVYFVGAFWVALTMAQWISLPFIALFGFGFAYVAFLSLAHGVTRWPRPAVLSEQPN